MENRHVINTYDGLRALDALAALLLEMQIISVDVALKVLHDMQSRSRSDS
jgi:hypothetical protein